MNSVLTQFLSIRVAWFWEALLVEAEFMGNSQPACIITMNTFAPLLLSVHLTGVKSSGTKRRGSRVLGKKENHKIAIDYFLNCEFYH